MLTVLQKCLTLLPIDRTIILYFSYSVYETKKYLVIYPLIFKIIFMLLKRVIGTLAFITLLPLEKTLYK